LLPGRARILARAASEENDVKAKTPTEPFART
jgi:hypothetical protein